MSPRNEEYNAMVKDERREQILSAALKVFATKGFAAAKISDIVARANVSHGLVYHYFKSKEVVFLELLKRAMFTSMQTLQDAEQLPLGPLEKIRHIAQYILGGMEHYEDSAYYFLIVVHASVMEVPNEGGELISQSSESIQAMIRILREGQEKKEIRPGDPVDMAMTFFAAIQGLAIYKLAVKDFKIPDPELIVNIVKNS